MSRSARSRRSRRPPRCLPASEAADGLMSRSLAAARTPSSPTARANCSTAPARAASTCSFSPAARSTATAISIWSASATTSIPKARFPGSFGSAYLYYVVPKVILFRVEHSRRTLVPKVDFVSAPGGSADNVFRPGGPIALVTNRCLFDFDRARRRFRLGQRASRTQRRGSDREYRLRFRPAGGRAGDAGAVGRDLANDAFGRRADAGRGLSAIRQECIRICRLTVAPPCRAMVFMRPQHEGNVR